tara:strand:- start:300 stop:1202 length:903 start_codon:yes stop_codon:yes gene_type:complete
VIKLPFGVDVDKLIDDLRNFSWEAADILLSYSNIIKNSEQNIEVLKNKNINDPVTLADLKVNDLIINRLNQKYQNINWEILSEENFKIESNPCNNNAEWLWVLDPLDGTKDFIQGTGNYAMHLALNHRRKPCLGVVLIPEKNELWISYEDKLWCEKRDRSLIKTNVSKNKSLKEMILVTSKNHNNETLKKLIQEINFYDVVVMGSIGCKIASIVRGESDIYICLSLPGKSAPKDWDFAAPEAILKGAGGAITNIDNESLSYGKSNLEHGGIIVASNNYLVHPKICLQIKEIIKKHKIYPY